MDKAKVSDSSYESYYDEEDDQIVEPSPALETPKEDLRKQKSDASSYESYYDEEEDARVSEITLGMKEPVIEISNEQIQ